METTLTSADVFRDADSTGCHALLSYILFLSMNRVRYLLQLSRDISTVREFRDRQTNSTRLRRVRPQCPASDAVCSRYPDENGDYSQHDRRLHHICGDR